MKSKVFLACLMCLSLGISAEPSQAVGVSLNLWDHNHDGRWNRREYYAACRDWHWRHDHPYYRRAFYPGFDRWDLNHDGYLNAREVRTIRGW